jgi:hypothetical protein
MQFIEANSFSVGRLSEGTGSAVRAAHERGSSLIELAVTLLLVSLILGISLRGNELVSNSQVQGLAKEFQYIPRLISLYQDRYHAQPGDDPRASDRFGSGAISGNGNAAIDGNWYDMGGASEASRLWQHLRLAGLTSGVADPDAADYMERNRFGYQVGIQRGATDPARSPILNVHGAGLAGSFILCSRGVPGKVALSLDIKLDDGNPSTGNMLATLETGAAYSLGAAPATVGKSTTTDLKAEGSYIVCMGV